MLAGLSGLTRSAAESGRLAWGRAAGGKLRLETNRYPQRGSMTSHRPLTAAGALSMAAVALAATLVGSLLHAARAQDAEAPGAASPNEAAAGLLEAWKRGDAVALQRFVPEAYRSEAVRLLQASAVSTYELGDIEETSETEARCDFTWSVRLDDERFAQVVIEAARARALESGASEGQIEKQIELLREALPGQLPAFKAHFEKSEHVMRLARVDGRWFVEKPIEAPSDAVAPAPAPPGAAEEAAPDDGDR